MNKHHETSVGSSFFARYRNIILLKAILWRWETCASPANIVILFQGGKWPWIPWRELMLSVDDSTELATYTIQQVVCPSKSITCLWGTNIFDSSTLHCHLLHSLLSVSSLKDCQDWFSRVSVMKTHLAFSWLLPVDTPLLAPQMQQLAFSSTFLGFYPITKDLLFLCVLFVFPCVCIFWFRHSL